MKWFSCPFRTSKRSHKNYVNAKPGLSRYATAADTMLEIFNLFITPDMKDVICRHTNEEAVKFYADWKAKHPDADNEWKLLQIEELDCFIAILIKAGALRCRRESTREMWTRDASIRRSFFTASMSVNRYELISKFIRFDDKATRAERKAHDKLAAIRQIWELFVASCIKNFVPYEHLTVDEQLVAFRGKCPFRQYMKSKPARYGIKIWAAADVKTSYICNLQVYTGKGLDNVREKDQGLRVVKDLTQPYKGSWRGITTDNFFTSVGLAKYLLESKLTLLGTVRKNKPDTPAEISVKSRPEKSSMFAFTKDITMVSYIPKKGKMVHLLSTQHDDDIVSEADDNKPIMILDYNKTMGAVDNADKLVREYSCARRTKRWP
nr:PREDICTED: piggyBac transposable element-derived protein 4-like [Megachile rotundata]